MKDNHPDSCHLLLDSDDNRGNQTETSSVITSTSNISSSSQSNHEVNPAGKRGRGAWNHPFSKNLGSSNPNILFCPSRGFKTGLNLTSDNLNQRMVSRFTTSSSCSSEGDAGSNDHYGGVAVSFSGVTGDAINAWKKKKKDSIFKSLTSDNNRGDEKSPAGDHQKSQESKIEINRLNLETAKECRSNHHTFPQSFLHQNPFLHPVPSSSSQGISSVSPRIASKVTSQVAFSSNTDSVWTTCSCNR